jgi:hypothetical protein
MHEDNIFNRAVTASTTTTNKQGEKQSFSELIMNINNIRRTSAITETIPLTVVTSKYDDNHGKKHLDNHHHHHRHDKDCYDDDDENDDDDNVNHNNKRRYENDDENIVTFGSSHIHRVNKQRKSSSSSSLPHTMKSNPSLKNGFNNINVNTHKKNRSSTCTIPRISDALLSRLISSKSKGTTTSTSHYNKSTKRTSFTTALNSIISEEMKDVGIDDSDDDDCSINDDDDDI